MPRTPGTRNYAWKRKLALPPAGLRDAELPYRNSGKIGLLRPKKPGRPCSFPADRTSNSRQNKLQADDRPPSSEYGELKAAWELVSSLPVWPPCVSAPAV